MSDNAYQTNQITVHADSPREAARRLATVMGADAGVKPRIPLKSHTYSGLIRTVKE